MSVKTAEIKTHFGRCRCCLNYGYMKNMWSSHKYEDEDEVYAEMIIKCFALPWPKSECVQDDQICEQCIFMLRSANNFKNVIIDAQKKFTSLINDGRWSVKLNFFEEDDECLTGHSISDYGLVDKKDDDTEFEEIEFLEDEEILGKSEDTLDDDDLNTTANGVTVRERATEHDNVPIEITNIGSCITKTPEPAKGMTILETILRSNAKEANEVPVRKRATENDEVSIEITNKGTCRTKAPEPAKGMTILEKVLRSKAKDDSLNAKNVRNAATVRNDMKINNDKFSVKITNTRTCRAKMPETAKVSKIVKINLRSNAKGDDNLKTKATGINLRKRATEYNKATTKITNARTCETKTPETEKVLKIEKNTLRSKAKDTSSHTTSKKSKKDPKQIKTRTGNVILDKYRENVISILGNSNATPFRGYWGIGYGCTYCSEQRPKPADLKLHTLNQHHDVKQAIKAKYVGELIIKLDITSLKCKICGNHMDSLDMLTDHLSTHNIKIHSDIPNYIIPYKFDSDMLKCALCSVQYEHFKHLSEHMIDHFRNFECDQCERGFLNKSALKIHLKRHEIGVFTCSFCPKVFDAKVRMREHEKTLHGRDSMTRKCGYCDEKFRDLPRRTAHEVKVHGAKAPVFECKACGKTFRSQFSLKLHTNTVHLLMLPHVCKECGQGFVTPSKLKVHSVKHTGVREHQCKVCFKRFAAIKSFRMHMRIHNNDRRYVCNVCGEAFVQKPSLTLHLRKHKDIVGPKE